MWNIEYEKLSINEKEEFTRLINLLLSKNFILRDKFDAKERTMRISYDYRFVERNFDLFRAYLKISGWELQRDNNYGVISLYNRYELNRIRLDKFTTCTLFILRLIYEEEREKLSLKREILTSTGEVIKKMLNLGIVSKKPSDRDIQASFSTIRGFNIIDRVEGFFADFDCRIIIYPSILFVVTNDKITSIYDMLGSDMEDEVAIESEEDEE